MAIQNRVKIEVAQLVQGVAGEMTLAEILERPDELQRRVDSRSGETMRIVVSSIDMALWKAEEAHKREKDRMKAQEERRRRG